MTWTRPVCPVWMEPTEYAAIPETLEVRVTRFTIREPGRRTREIEVVTTLTDADAYSRDDIAELFGPVDSSRESSNAENTATHS